jgi:CheY-like chemotaxis protein
LNILIVEDNADDVVLLEHAFQKSNFQGKLNSVSDGVEAIAYLTGEGSFANRGEFPVPDLVLLDLNMPRKNGFEVLSWIRAEPRFVRLMVHVLSASARPADIDRAYELHANSYTVKPTRLDELVEFAVTLQRWHRFVSLGQSAGEHKFVACGSS